MAWPKTPLLERAGDAIARTKIEVAAILRERNLPATDDTCTLGALLATAYPAYRRAIEAHPDDLVAIARSGLKVRRNAKSYDRLTREYCPDLGDAEGVRRGLRVLARREKMRIAARELFPTWGDVDVAARELSDLADRVVGAALDEALAWAKARFGEPVTAQGARCGYVVLGMGKLGGYELNAGSDVDLLPFYETDDGAVIKDGKEADVTLHELYVRVTQRLTSTLDDATADGVVWRVDLRLRPEGSRGPLVNALAAAERYYETWGRTWERAALLRARPIAGDLAFGARVLEALTPFVWRRVVRPGIAAEMAELVVRSRAELSNDPERDLKHGVGGIREAEFFVQSLQLIWGGKDPSLRAQGTLDALLRLRSRGLVTEREARDVRDGYLALRRIEHRIQNATGLHTHDLPRGDVLSGIAKSLGFPSDDAFLADLAKVRATVAKRLASIVVAGADETPTEIVKLFVALDGGEEERVREALPAGFGLAPDLPRHLLALAKRPEDPLGSKTRDDFPTVARETVRALAEAADPEQASRLLGAFFSRLKTPGVYVRLLASDLRVLYRLVGLFGASAFLGGALTGHPELVDRLLFGRGAPTPESARAAVSEEIATPHEHDDDPADALVGALRRAKGRVTMEVGLAELSGEIGSREAQRVLTALAEETLERALRASGEERGVTDGLVVVGMGKLGGRELGYGSDLDIFFVYRDTDDDDIAEKYVRTAQRVLRLVSVPHGDGPGYELDTRLRPSGSQGLLVVPVSAFRKYHAERAGKDPEAADWERQALLRARVVAGDPSLGDEVIAVARHAAYDRGAPPAARMHALRLRMEHELGRERRDHGGRLRLDLKVGYGGIADVEFAVQFLQMTHGQHEDVRTEDTEAALVALEARGLLDPHDAAVLGDRYRALRRLEQALRVSTGTAGTVMEEGKPGMTLLARRLGMRDGPGGSAAHALFAHVHSVTKDVRAVYLGVLGREPPPSQADVATTPSEPAMSSDPLLPHGAS